MKHVWVLAILCLAPTLHALEVQVGSSFTITGIMRQEGKSLLPQQRTYYDIRIMDRNTYDFVATCHEPCKQTVGQVDVAVEEVRPAKTHPDMWIVSVRISPGWLVTFLVFREGNNRWSVKNPAHFKFLDKSLQTQTREKIIAAVGGISHAV